MAVVPRSPDGVRTFALLSGMAAWSGLSAGSRWSRTASAASSWRRWASWDRPRGSRWTTAVSVASGKPKVRVEQRLRVRGAAALGGEVVERRRGRVAHARERNGRGDGRGDPCQRDDVAQPDDDRRVRASREPLPWA